MQAREVTEALISSTLSSLVCDTQTTSTQKAPKLSWVSFKFRVFGKIISSMICEMPFCEISARTQLPLSLLHTPDSSWKHCPESPRQTSDAENLQSAGTDSRNKSGPLRVEPGAVTSNRIILISQRGKTTMMFAFHAQQGSHQQPVFSVPRPSFRDK